MERTLLSTPLTNLREAKFKDVEFMFPIKKALAPNWTAQPTEDLKLKIIRK